MNTSKSGIRWLKEGIAQVACSKEGADEFVDTVGTDFISTNLTSANDEELNLAYKLMIAVAENVSPEMIASGIPESELRIFIEHTLKILFKTLFADRNWLRSGAVSQCHEMLLQTVASFSQHPSFLKIFLSSTGMEAAAKFYASRKKKNTPSRGAAQLIVFLVNNSLCAFIQEGLREEKVFGILEKTCLLRQSNRCVPVDLERSAATVTTIVTGLQPCLQLVKKKFKSGTPTGDILAAEVAGEDGPINVKARSTLARLQSLARLSNNKCTDLKVCHHCDTLETQMGSVKLMKCQSCKVAYCCSKNCQIADWKIHKKRCNEIKSGVDRDIRSTLKTSQRTMLSFITSNYFDIAKEVYKKTQEYNVPKKELLVEINFYGDVPALRNEFKVCLESDSFEESSVDEVPDWDCSHIDSKVMTEACVEGQTTSDELPFVCKAGNGMVSVCSLGLPVEGYQYQSDEAVEAIGREDYVRMVACLELHTTDEYFRGKGVAWMTKVARIDVG
jgi:hypothetical protein